LEGLLTKIKKCGCGEQIDEMFVEKSG